MNRKRIHLIIILAAAWLFTIACSAALPSFAKPKPVGPKAGHWEGKPSLSFDVLPDGSVANFQMTASIGMNTCKLEVPKGNIEGGKNFLISEWSSYTDEMRAFIDYGVKQGAKQPATKSDKDEQLVESLHVEGVFDTPETVKGTYLLTICENNIFAVVQVPEWDAKWVKP